MSYAELAAARGIDVQSAVKRVRRRRWPRQKGNDGTVRVAVPLTFLETARDRSPDQSRHSFLDQSPDLSHKISALEALLEAANERIGQVEAQNRDLQEHNAQLREARAAAEALATERAAALAWLTRRRWWQLRQKPRG